MKNSIYILFTALFLFISCSEDFLTQKNLYEKSDENYYTTPEDIAEALTGAYSALPNDGGRQNPFVLAKLMSDDAFAGGGTNDNYFAAIDAFSVVSSNDYDELFATSWRGILRVNMIITRFDQVE